MFTSARIRDWDGATVMLLLVGLIPLAGQAVLGDWPRWEVGAGTAICLVALHELVWPR